jgi:hypothetical protein
VVPNVGDVLTLEVSRKGAMSFFINNIFIRTAFTDPRISSNDAIPYVALINSKVKLLKGRCGTG